MSTIVYQYGLLPPTANGVLVREQMRAVHVYRNALVALERERREKLRAIMEGATEGIRTAEAARDAAQGTVEQHEGLIKAVRSRRHERAEPRAERDLLTAARKRLTETRKCLAEARRQARDDPVLMDLRARVEADIHPRVLAAYAECAAYAPSKDLVRSAMDQSRRMPLWDGTEPNDPRFLRWEGEGALGVQLLSTSCVSEAGRARWLRLESTGELGSKARPTSKRSQRRRRMELSMRVGSEGQDPVWATWPMLMHRPLPHGAIIRRATVHCRKVGPTERWCVDLTLQVPDGWKGERCGAGEVALDLGWREKDEGLRVGYWVGADGSMGELALPARLMASLTEPAGLQAVRDKSRDHLARWLWRWRQKRLDTLPEWMRELTGSLCQWRSQARFASLTRRWTRECPELFSRVLAVLEKWRYHDYHLWEWCEHARANALATRRKLYREWGAMLARRYSCLVVEDFDVRDVARRKPTEADAENEHARSMRQLAAVSELRGACQQAFVSRGGRWEMRPAEHPTDTCWRHNAPAVSNPAADVVVRYECGCIEDQDEHAARALLTRERSREPEKPAGARRRILASEAQHLPGTKWQRRAAKAAEKLAQKETARNVESRA